MDAKAYAARNRQGSDWFMHKAEPEAQVERAPITDAPPSSKAQMIKPVCNSNQWFKHDESKNDVKHSDGDGIQHQQQQQQNEKKAENNTSSACATWCIGGSDAKAAEAEPRSRVVTKEGEANCMRDKASSDWFSHDPNGTSRCQSGQGHRIGSAEGNQNASRMRGESENWFSHDPKAPPEPLHSSKGRPTSKAHGSDMYNVFHHDQ